MPLQNIIVTASINSQATQSYNQKTYIASTDEQSFPIERIVGDQAGVWPNFKLRDLNSTDSASNTTINQIINVTQSWSGSNITISGSVPYIQNTLVEFFNGEFSGSVYLVTNGSLIDEDCEQCGVGEVSEGVCNECGSSSGMMDESEEMVTNEGGCKSVREVIKSQNGEVTELDQELLERYNCGSLKESLIRRGLMKESLKGNQKKIDKNKNNKIDSEDFALLRKGKKTETKEGSKPDFLDLDKDGDKKEPMKKASKEKKGKKETVRVTESELISLIEEMVNEEFETIGTKPRGLSEYERAHKKSGSENKEYFKSLKKKMDDYLKDGSKGDYEENPKHFPKGNGELEKMKAKKYTMSKDGDEFIDNFMRPGQENLDYDEIHPDEKWMGDNIEGSSRTGNNPKWANAEETELGKKINKKRKDNKFAKATRQAYNKSAQPVISDKTGEDSGKGLNIKLESTDKKEKVLNEEFNKIKNLMSYNRKTQ